MSQAKNKTQPTKASVKEFLAGVENIRRRKDGETLMKLMRATSLDITTIPAITYTHCWHLVVSEAAN